MKVMRGYVAVRADEAESVTAGGIVLTERSKEDVHRGKVVAVGDGVYLESGAQLEAQVRIGDRVFYKPYQTHEVEVKWSLAEGGTEMRTFLIIKETELLLVL